LLFFIISGLTAGLTILAKESGIGFLLGGIILLIVYKTDKKKIFFYLGAALLPVIIYIIWGLWFFPALFEKIFLFNSSTAFLVR